MSWGWAVLVPNGATRPVTTQTSRNIAMARPSVTHNANNLPFATHSNHSGASQSWTLNYYYYYYNVSVNVRGRGIKSAQPTNCLGDGRRGINIWNTRNNYKAQTWKCPYSERFITQFLVGMMTVQMQCLRAIPSDEWIP